MQLMGSESAILVGQHQQICNLLLEINNTNIPAKEMEQKFNADYKNCKSVFIACSKLEDEAIEYMIKCYTSSSSVQSNIKELLYIKDASTKVKTVSTSLVSDSRRRVKRQKNTEEVTCAYYITEVQLLNTVMYTNCQF